MEIQQKPKGRPKNQPPISNEARREGSRIALAREDLVDFIDYVFRDNNGEPVESQPHQIAWWEHVNYCIRIGKTPCILAPMGSAKTSWMAIGFELFMLGQNPNFRIMLVSSAEDIAAKRLQTIGRYIKDSVEYRRVFPWVVPDEKSWNKEEIKVLRRGKDGGFVGSVDPSISAYGYTASKAIGARSDITVFDDVADMKNSVVSAVTRETLHQLVFNTFMGRDDKATIRAGGLKDREGNVLSPRSIRLFIGTRYHVEDVYGHILKNAQSYCTLVQRVSKDFKYLDTEVVGAVESPMHPVYKRFRSWEYGQTPNNEREPLEPIVKGRRKLVTVPPLVFKMPTWEGVMDPEEMELTAMTLGPSAFERGYRQQPQADTDLMFPSFAEKVIYDWGFDWRKISEGPEPDTRSKFYVDPKWPRYIGVDLSSEKRRGNVIFVIALAPDNTRHVLDIKLGAWKSPETARHIQEAYEQYSPKAIFVENNAYQESIIHWMQEGNLKDPGSFTCVNKIEPFTTGNNKMNPEIGLPSIEFQYHLGAWRLGVPHKEYQPTEPSPHDNSVCICGFCMFVRATQTFTQADLKETPDVIAAQFIAKEASRLYGSMSDSTIGIVRASQVDMAKVLEAAQERAQAMRIPAGQPHLAGGRRNQGKDRDGFGRPVARYAKQIAEREAIEAERRAKESHVDA